LCCRRPSPRRAGPAQPHRRARPSRSGRAAPQHHPGRGLRKGRRHRHVGATGLLDAGPAPRHRACDPQRHVCRVQAAVAALHQSAGAPVGDGARVGRRHRAGRDRHQRADSTLRNGGPPCRMTACRSRSSPAGRRSAVRRAAGDSRRRSRHPHQGPQRHRVPRPRQCGDAVGPSPDDGDGVFEVPETLGEHPRLCADNGSKDGAGGNRPLSMDRLKDTSGSSSTRRRAAATFWRRSTCAAAGRGDQGRHHHYSINATSRTSRPTTS